MLLKYNNSKPVLWPPHVKSWLIGKDSDAGRDWGQEEKGSTEDEMAGWHHWLDGCESEWTLGDGDGQGGLVCSVRFMGSQRVGHNWATELNWTEWLMILNIVFYSYLPYIFSLVKFLFQCFVFKWVIFLVTKLWEFSIFWIQILCQPFVL